MIKIIEMTASGSLLLLALLGHTSFWVGLVNRSHGRAWPEWLLRLLSVGCILAWAGLLAGFLGLIPNPPHSAGLNFLSGFPPGKWFGQLGWPAQVYVAYCWIRAGRNLWWWFWHHLCHRPPKLLLTQQVETLPLTQPARRHPDHHPLVWLPQNEILQLQLTRREILLPLLPPAWEGLRILHLSDLHFTGRVAQPWFRQAMEQAAELNPDLVAFTGDFLDTMDCLDWIPEVLAPLKGRLGVYFILGNHDWRLDWPRIRAQLEQVGFVSLGGRWILIGPQGPPAFPPSASPRHPQGAPPPLPDLLPCPPTPTPFLPASNPPKLQEAPPPGPPLPSSSQGAPQPQPAVLLAGNELPWIGPAPDLTSAPPPACQGGPIRILLAHSPDQFQWARKHQFDLMLAGHTHGGQVRMPLIGPILTPSKMGIRYSDSLYHEPPTLLHVSRGISAQWPLRWNCPPELVLLILRCAGRP